MDILQTINSFADQKVLVLGEAMLDVYRNGVVTRLSPQAPVPVVDVHSLKQAPGGAGNTASNLVRLGANVHFLSVVGQDEPGTDLLNVLPQYGVSTESVLVDPEIRTLTKQYVAAGDHLLVRFDTGTSTPIPKALENKLIAVLRNLYAQCDAVVISDYRYYDYNLMTDRILEVLQELKERHPRTLVIDSKRLDRFRKLAPTVVKPNYENALLLLGLTKREHGAARVRQIEEEGERIRQLAGAEVAIVTLDVDGSLMFQAGKQPYRTFSKPMPNTKVAGAGDTFVSAVTLALASGASPELSVEIAQGAARVVVAKSGTASCSTSELIQFFTTDSKHIRTRQQLAELVERYRKEGRRMVFSNGCFDILHSGHVAYLRTARLLGDVLILGLNSDESIRRLKGPERPINTLEDRLRVLSGLDSVDHVVPFNEDTPIELIKIVKPDIFVKGGDYSRETLPETPLVELFGGRVEIIPLVPGKSTTKIIRSIHKRRVPAAL